MPIPLLLLPLLMLPPSARAFAPPSSPSSRRLLVAAAPRTTTTTTTTSLAAKNGGKKKKSRSNNASGAGFGKAPATTTTATAPPATLQDEGAASSASISGGLQSIDGGGTQQQQRQPEVLEQLDLPDDMPEEERSRAILRQKFGLKSYEEQQADIGDYRAVLDAEKKKKEKRNKLRNLDEVWPEDADVLAVLPPVAIRGIDTFLKVGLGVCTVTFLVAGIFITVEAWSKATGGELPAGLGLWIESVVEPNFTPGLGVLLAFSVSLGLFSVALGGSASSTYREDP